MKNEVNLVLEGGETIVWEGLVNRKVLLLNLILSLVVIVIISSFLFSKESIHYTSNGIPKVTTGAAIAKIVLGIGTILSFLSFFSNLVKRYLITNKRVLIKSGLIGTDFMSLYFTQMRSANVEVGLMDKLFSVGTISIDTGKVEAVSSGSGNNQSTGTRTAFDKLSHIDKPYEVYKYFQTALTGREESLYSGRADRENIARTAQ